MAGKPGQCTRRKLVGQQTPPPLPVLTWACEPQGTGRNCLYASGTHVREDFLSWFRNRRKNTLFPKSLNIYCIAFLAFGRRCKMSLCHDNFLIYLNHLKTFLYRVCKPSVVQLAWPSTLKSRPVIGRAPSRTVMPRQGRRR